MGGHDATRQTHEGQLVVRDGPSRGARRGAHPEHDGAELRDLEARARGPRDADVVGKVSLRLPLEPFGAARQRVRAVPTGKRNARGEMIHRGQTYMDPKYAKWRDEAMPYFETAAPAAPLTGPLEVLLVAVVSFRATRRRKTTMPPRIWHATRPDIDNVLKAVLDCAQEAGWFLNDWQVARGVVEKVEAAQGEAPALSVVVRKLETPYHLR